jgi:hypothetical protein
VEKKREEAGRKTGHDVGGWMIFFIIFIVFSDTILDDLTVNIIATNINEFRCV